MDLFEKSDFKSYCLINYKMSYCNFIGKTNKKCTNSSVSGFNFCHIKSHYPSKQTYEDMYNFYLKQFEDERLKVAVEDIQEVEPDGACLFRSLSRGLFYLLDNDLDILKEKFVESQYFDDEDFLKDFMEISECFKTEDFQMETDLEEDIAKGLQTIICNFIEKNKQLDISKILNKNAADDEIIHLENLIFICHEMSIDEYLESYQRFAGEDDFILEDITQNGKTKKKKVFINDRWGGIPEIVVFSILFDVGIYVYMPQKFTDKINSITINKLPKKGWVYLKNMENINIGENNIKLLLRQYKNCSHYDYIS